MNDELKTKLGNDVTIVEKELDEFLKLQFFKRCGGGIGVTRLIRAMKLSNVLYDDKTSMSTQSQTMKLQNQESVQNLATRV